MYRLLIVDDESNITDGLYIFFRSIEHIELDVYKAYSGFEALEILNNTRIDIVLTDICMPGLTGLQLLEKIHSSWPKCKIIFLTGYDEFDYVYTAIKHEGVSYLLKNEGYEEIAKAVENAAAQIDASLKTSELVDRAKKYISAIMPFMQKEYLADILNGDFSSNESRKQQFEELGIPLNPELPVLLVIGRFDNMPTGISSTERMKLFCSIKLVAEQNFPAVITAVHITCERSVQVWFIQPAEFIETGWSCNVIDFQWKQLLNLIKGSVETIQSVCMNSLNVSISFILDSDGTAWENMSKKYDSLKLLLYSRIGVKMDIHVAKTDTCEYSEMQSEALQFKKLKLLETYLESGQKKEFLQLLTEAMECLTEVESKYNNSALEIFYSISLMFLSYINRCNLTEKIAFEAGMNKLTRVDEHASWKDALEYFRELACIIFEYMDSEEEKNTVASVNYIKQYINTHLKDDLSLARLAEKVYFNPSYFSRIFKQTTGVNLLSYINDVRIGKAKELLRNSSLKIHEIAVAVGYDSPSYFTQFFKRLVNISPQEYRDAVSTGKEI